jgi:hypothetical protein
MLSEAGKEFWRNCKEDNQMSVDPRVSSEQDAAADAALAALFGEVMRPPMVDEAFTASVLARVERARSRKEQVALGLTALGLGVGAAFLVPALPRIVPALADAFSSTSAQYLPALAGAPVALLLALAIAGGALLYAERS